VNIILLATCFQFEISSEKLYDDRYEKISRFSLSRLYTGGGPSYETAMCAGDE
jgi:hypothetical protein